VHVAVAGASTARRPPRRRTLRGIGVGNTYAAQLCVVSAARQRARNVVQPFGNAWQRHSAALSTRVTVPGRDL